MWKGEIMTKKNEEKTVLTFTKEQIVNSKKYELHKDFLNGNLKDNQLYALEEVDALIEKHFKKGTGE